MSHSTAKEERVLSVEQSFWYWMGAWCEVNRAAGCRSSSAQFDPGWSTIKYKHLRGNNTNNEPVCQRPVNASDAERFIIVQEEPYPSRSVPSSRCRTRPAGHRILISISAIPTGVG